MKTFQVAGLSFFCNLAKVVLLDDRGKCIRKMYVRNFESVYENKSFQNSFQKGIPTRFDFELLKYEVLH